MQSKYKQKFISNILFDQISLFSGEAYIFPILKLIDLTLHRVRKQQAEGVDCGDEAAERVSKHLKQTWG